MAKAAQTRLRRGRPERPLDTDAGPVQQLAWDLRQLREAAGRPSYRALAGKAHYAASTLAEAAKGDRLPSLPVLLAYARACGAPAAEWETRWRAAAAQLASGTDSVDRSGRETRLTPGVSGDAEGRSWGARRTPLPVHGRRTDPARTAEFVSRASRVDLDSSSTVVPPAQLPADVMDFTGHAAVVRELSDRLATAQERGMAVSVISGAAGMGKSTVAIHVAHSVRRHYPDGQLYVDLYEAGHTATEPTVVLGGFLRTLGVPRSAIPTGPAERAALYRSVLDGRRVLVLLDNARDTAHVSPLLPGTAGCAALVTNRTGMVNVPGAHVVRLPVMSSQDALALFTRVVGEERVNADRAAALDTVTACGFLPLAIRIAASRLTARGNWTVRDLACQLADERRRLDTLRIGNEAITSVFALGYRRLRPRQARAFRLLGLTGGRDISLPAAAAVLGLGRAECEEILESLVDASLLESVEPGRYRYHDLLRLYAHACAIWHEPSQERDAAMTRLLDFRMAAATSRPSLP